MAFRNWDEGDEEKVCMRKGKEEEGEGSVLAIPLNAALEAIRTMA